jgi:hypothetical protein
LKTEGVLEAHCGGDAGKGLVVDGGQRIGLEKTSDTGPKSKHKQKKTGNNKELTKQEKSKKGAQSG